MNYPPVILVAEDEENDVLLLRHAFESGGCGACVLEAVPDGQGVVAYLEGRPPWEDRQAHPLPDLLLLDLKMPGMNGFEVLAWLRGRGDFRSIPVLVLSSSILTSDMEKATDLGAREFLSKPNNIQDLVGLVQEVYKRWLQRPGVAPGPLNEPASARVDRQR